jgi:SAM-dependent methyltransferase
LGAEEIYAIAAKPLVEETASAAGRAATEGLKFLDDAMPSLAATSGRGTIEVGQQALAHRLWDSILCDWDAAKITENLDIPPGELDTPGYKILDLGAGSQHLAKEGTRLNLRSQIFSVEPRLALSQSAENQFVRDPRDLSSLRPAHPLAIAALSDNLPFADQTFDRVYGHFSVPFYQNDPTELRNSMREIFRVLKPDGIGRFAPITRRNRMFVETLQSLDVPFTMTDVSPIHSNTYGPEAGWRLVTKPRV